jgi:hypothetical protein
MFPQPPPNVVEAYTSDGSRYYVRAGNEVSETRRITTRRLETNLDEKIQQIQHEFVLNTSLSLLYTYNTFVSY